MKVKTNSSAKAEQSAIGNRQSAIVSPRRLIAIIGNPNAGKTTIFNGLTGSHQKVGNYPGVTVEKISGEITIGDQIVECIDVPGLYSMAPVSEDERVAAEVVAGESPGLGRPELLVVVLDSTNLERNLYIFTQLADDRRPMVVALTMVDRLEKNGFELDLPRLSNLLGVEVVPVIGHKEKSWDALKAAIERGLENPKITEIHLGLPDAVETRVAGLRERLSRFGADFTASEIRAALLAPTEEFQGFLAEYPEVGEHFEAAREELAKLGEQPREIDIATRYQWSAMVQRAAIRQPASSIRKLSLTDRLDLILTNRVAGFAIFVGMMYLVFQSIYSFAQPFMDLIGGGFKAIAGFVSPHLAGAPILRSLIVDGLIKGLGAMLVFLPQILILFFFISVLEGTGYLARAAFLMDRLLGWCGLNGRAFIPLLSSFACAIPGIMAARVMPDARSRLATILVAPLMSCSARLPVYLLLIGAFIQPRYGAFWAGFTLFAMHLLGLVVSIPIAWFFNRKLFRGRRLPFLLELPPYQWPKWRDVWLAMYFRARIFVKTAGTIIVFMSILIWAAGYFPQLSPERAAQMRTEYAQAEPGATARQLDQKVEQEHLAESYLGRFGRTIEPAFLPAGFDWRITTGILSAFPARETIVPTLGIIFSLGSDVDEKDVNLQKVLADATWPDGRPLFTPWTAVGLMVFFALCAQCMATLATVKRETNSWKWPVFMFSYMTILAYIAAVAIHQLGLYFGSR